MLKKEKKDYIARFVSNFIDRFTTCDFINLMGGKEYIKISIGQ